MDEAGRSSCAGYLSTRVLVSTGIGKDKQAGMAHWLLSLADKHLDPTSERLWRRLITQLQSIVSDVTPIYTSRKCNLTTCTCM